MRFSLTRATLIKAALLFAAWTAYGVFCAVQSHYWYAFSRMPISWFDAFRYQLTYAWLWALASPLILWFADRYRFERKVWPRRLLIHICLMVVIVTAAKVGFSRITMPPLGPFRDFTWLKLFRAVEADFDMGVLLYGIVVLVEHARIFYNRYEAGLISSSQLQTQLVQAQLRALKMQLHPHFLFNTLHTITALVHEDPELAERTITRLGELLRLFLNNSAIHEVPLSQEIHILDLYLEIERTRFEDRLQVHYDIPPALQGATVPNLVLQPLVENSIRHGLSQRAQPGSVSIAAECYGDTLVIRVTDNGVGFPEEKDLLLQEGMGLAITRGRLESLYGTRQSLAVRNLPAGGVEAKVTLPLVLRAESSRERENYYAEFQNSNR